MRSTIIILIFTLMIAHPAPARGRGATQGGRTWAETSSTTNDPVVARINGEPLRMKEFSRHLTRQYGGRAIDWFVERVLIQQAASKHGLEATPKEVQARQKLEIRLRLQEFFNRTRMTPSLFQKVSEKYGLTRDKLRDDIASSISRDQMRRQVLLDKLLENEIELSEDELRQYYHWQYGQRIAGAHIVVGSSQKARQIASALRDKASSWGSLVRNHSLDQRSAPYGGRFRPVPVNTQLGKALRRLGEDRAGLYHPGQRWHVIRQTDRIPPSNVSFDNMRSELARELLAIKIQDRAGAYIADLRRQATVITNVSPTPQRRRVLGRNVIAYVNQQPVSVTQFGRAMVRRFGRNIIVPLIEQKLVLQEARNQGVTVSDEEVQNRRGRMAETIRRWQNSSSPTNDDIPSFSAEENAQNHHKGQSSEQYVSSQTVRALLLAEKMAVDRVYVNEQELREAYSAQYGRHVVLEVIVTGSASRARALRQRALEGASFALLAQAHSRARSSLQPQGFRTRSTPGQPYYKHVKGLKTGDIAPVLQYGNRYHLIKLLARKQPQNAPSLTEVREKLERRVKKKKSQRRIRAWLKKLKAESRVNIIKSSEL